MKNMKVLVLIVLLLATGALLFAKGDQESTGTADGEKMELTVLYDYAMPENAPIKLRIEEAFNVKLNCLSNKATSTEENKQKLQLMVTSGQKIDAFIAYDYTMLKKFAEQGVIAEVPVDLIEEEAPRMYNYLMGIFPGAWAFTNVNGKNYGFPTAWPLGDHSRTMSIRVDWLENLGMEIPETLSDLEKALYAFRNDDPDGNVQKDTYGMSFYKNPGNIQAFAPIYGAYGAHPQIFQVKDGELVWGSIIPEAKEALTTLNKWYEDEIIDPSFFVDDYTVFQEKWISGKFGLIPDTWWWTAGPSAKYYSGALYDPVIAANPEAKPTTIPPPVGPDGDQGMRQRVVMEVIPMIVFGKHLENDLTKVRKFFNIWDELLNTEKWQVFIYHGDEGVTYRRTEEGTLEWIPPYDVWEKREEYGMNYFSWVPNYEIYDTATKDGAWIKKERAKAIGPMDAIGGYPLESWTKYKVNLNTIEEKAYIGFITGRRPLSEFDDFVQEWMNAGGKEVLEEARQVYKEKFQN
jgi:putative aldouronate transport system substrate-binding protein